MMMHHGIFLRDTPSTENDLGSWLIRTDPLNRAFGEPRRKSQSFREGNLNYHEDSQC